MSENAGTEHRLRVRLFGQFEVEKQGQPIDLPTRNAEALLAYLILNPGTHPREKVAAQFWGDVSDRKARASLRNELATVRRLLDSRLLRSTRQTVALNPDYPLWVDAWKFENFLRRQDDPGRANTSDSLRDLYRGPLLEGFYHDWILSQRDRFKERFIGYLLDRAEASRAQSEYARAVEYADHVLSMDPVRERAHQHLMFCYAALGNRTAALQQYEICRDLLRDELGVEPAPETRELREWIHRSAEKPPAPAARITNIPDLPESFVGRSAELSQIKSTLEKHRLITLTGAGGIGKTRLAIKAASELTDQFQDGVWWVDLSSIADPNHVKQAIAKALGVQETRGKSLNEVLLAVLRQRQMLLLLDNTEHLLREGARWSSLLMEACPDLKLLVTSRQPLGLPAEHVITVPPLSLPELERPQSVETVSATESAKLFLDRARAVRKEFKLTRDNARQVAKLCLQLDGIPLAIELAATRVNAMSLDQMIEHLNDHLDLVTEGSSGRRKRHQSLQAAIDWSYHLLTESEQNLFRRLAVFAGGFSQAAASSLYPNGDQAADQDIEAEVPNSASLDLPQALANLVDKSLLMVTDWVPQPRYRMLDTIRQFATDLLEESGGAEVMRRRHLGFFTDFATAPNPHLGFFLSDAEMEQWAGPFEREEDNVRAAMNWASQGPNKSFQGLQIAVALHWYWFIRGRFSEGRSILRQLLDAYAGGDVNVRARAWLTLGFLTCWQGDFEAAGPSLERARRLFQDSGNQAGVAFVTHGQGFTASGFGQEEHATELFQSSLELAQEIDDGWLVAFNLHFLGIGYSFQEQYGEATEALEEGIERLQEMGGNAPGVGYSHYHLARIARLERDVERANRNLEAALSMFGRIGEQRGIAYVLAEMVALSLMKGQPEFGARLAGALAALQEKLGPLLEETLQTDLEASKESARQEIGRRAYKEAFAAGRENPIEETIELAVGVGYP